MSQFETEHVSRRQFLGTVAALTGAAYIGSSVMADEKDPYGGFKMGLQSYSLRHFKVEEALQHTQKLGVKVWEAFPGHIPQNNVPSKIAEQKKMLDDAGIKLMAYGVVGFDTNETKARTIFDYAKAMGIVSLSADPGKDKPTFDLLDKLVAEYDIAIAIHNHGPGHRYNKISDVEEVVKDRHPKIGACVDTGHYLRSDEKPEEAIERLGKRVFGVHFKDVKTHPDGKKQFRILGEGDLNIVACLKILKKLNYQYALALEYEENPTNPLSDIEVCLKAVRDGVAKL